MRQSVVWISFFSISFHTTFSLTKKTGKQNIITTTRGTMLSRRMFCFIVATSIACMGASSFEFGRNSKHPSSFSSHEVTTRRRRSKLITPFQSLEALVVQDEFDLEEHFRHLSTLSMSFSYSTTGSPTPPFSPSGSPVSSPVSSPVAASPVASPTSTTTTTSNAATTAAAVWQNGATSRSVPADADNWECADAVTVAGGGPTSKTVLNFYYEAQVENGQDDAFVADLDEAMAYAMVKDGCDGTNGRRMLEVVVSIVSVDALPKDEIDASETCFATNANANACRVVKAGMTFEHVPEEDNVETVLESRFLTAWKNNVDEWVESSPNVVELKYLGQLAEEFNAAGATKPQTRSVSWRVPLICSIIGAILAFVLVLVATRKRDHQEGAKELNTDSSIDSDEVPATEIGTTEGKRDESMMDVSLDEATDRAVAV